MKKLLLVNPRPKRSGFSVNPSSLFPPLGLGILSNLTPDDWWVELADENFMPFELRDADLVGITAFTAAAPRAYEIAKLCRDNGSQVVMGGAHASVRPIEALRHCDAVVVGEAEPVWRRVLWDFNAGQLARTYAAPPGKIATPDRSIFDCRYTRKTIQTSRGCPLDCDFCSVSAVNGTRYRSRLLEDAKADLASFAGDHFFIVDDNFVGYGKTRRDYVAALLRHMIDLGAVKPWICQTSINVAKDPELLALMAAAGCCLLFIGIETEDGTSLIRNNCKRDFPCQAAMTIIHEHGIAVLGAFIIGLEDDDREAILRRSEFIRSCGADAFQVSIMTPLPGTRLFNRAEDTRRLRTRDWSRYDFTDTVYLPAAFETEEQFRQTIIECLDPIYDPSFLKERAKATQTLTGSEVAAWFAYRSNYNYMNIYYERIREESTSPPN